MIDDEEFEQLLPITVRRESVPKSEGEEIFKMPTWHCFCCHDTGWVQYHLAKRVIKHYNPTTNANPTCQNCKEGARWAHLKGNIDPRLTRQTCQRLDVLERRNWEETVRIQFENFLHNKETTPTQKTVLTEVDKIAAVWSLRQRARNSEEQSTAQYKHELVSSDRYEGVRDEEE